MHFIFCLIADPEFGIAMSDCVSSADYFCLVMYADAQTD